MMKKSCIVTIFLAILFLFCIITLFSEETADIVIKELSSEHTYSIDPEHDVERIFPGGKGKITFPKGSINEKTNIKIQRVEIAYDKKRFRQMADVHRFEPHGLQFKKPVLLTLGYKELEFPEEYIHIYYYNALADNWSIMEKVEQDKENNTITAKITHFSAYVPGVGSYTIEEGISPNTSFFKNNNENVDLNKGNLHITRTDVSIPGRGVDLVIQTAFNSDGYFWANDDQNEWAIAPEIEKKKKYKLAAGWRFKFPACITNLMHPGAVDFCICQRTGRYIILQMQSVLKLINKLKK